MPRLCLFGCKPPVSGPYVSMHRIPNPARYPERFKSWLSLLGRPLNESDYTEYQKARVCDIHFTVRDRTRNNRLNVMAVPSQNLREKSSKIESRHKGNQGRETKLKTPNHPREENARKLHGDHTYSKNVIKHYDHTYTLMDDIKNSRKFDVPEVADQDIQQDVSNAKMDKMIEKDIYADDDDLGFNDSVRKDCQAELDVLDDLGFNDFGALKFSDQTGENVTDYGDILKDDGALSDKMDEGDDVVLDSGDEDDVVLVRPEDFGGKGDGENYVPEEHHGFRCNVCFGKIVGFRYRCCECEDYDMCSDCESRGQHPLHYVLRVPGYRKQCEAGRLMAALHLALAEPCDVKQELIKIEDPREKQTVPDPLQTECGIDVIAPSPRGQPAPPPAKKLKSVTSNKRGGTPTLKVIADKNTYPVALDALKRQAFVRLGNMKLPLQQNIVKRGPVESLHQRSTYRKFKTKKKKSAPEIVSKRPPQPTYSKRNPGNNEKIALPPQNTFTGRNNVRTIGRRHFGNE